MYSASGKYGEIGVSVVHPQAHDCNGKIKSTGHIAQASAKILAIPPCLPVYSHHPHFYFLPVTLNRLQGIHLFKDPSESSAV